jgi:hypothetical protein
MHIMIINCITTSRSCLSAAVAAAPAAIIHPNEPPVTTLLPHYCR